MSEEDSKRGKLMRLSRNIAGLGIIVALLCPKLLPQLIKHQAISAMGVSSETAKELNKLNAFTNVVASAMGPAVLDAPKRTHEGVRSEKIDLGWRKSDDSTTSDYGWTPLEIVNSDSDFRDANSTLVVWHVHISESWSYDHIVMDDILGVNTDLTDISGFLRNELYLPMKDNIHYFENDESRDRALQEMKLLPHGLEDGYVLPIPHHHITELVTDEALSRMFWYGIGAILIMGSEFSELYEDDKLVGFEINLDISSMKVRESFRSYGYRIQFDTDQRVVSIYDSGQDRLLLPEDGSVWGNAKFLVKQTTFTVLSLRQHLQWAHFLTGNAAAKANTIHLPPDHPVRRLLTIFTYGTHYVNADIQEVLKEKQWSQRMTAFEFEGMLDLFDTGYKLCDILRPFRDAEVGAGILALAESGRFPYYKEGLEYFALVHKFVNEWLAEAGDAAKDRYAIAFYEDIAATSRGQRYELPPYSHENMVDLIAQLVWVVTAYHEFVGGVVEYARLPELMGMRIARDGKPETDTEGFLLAAYLTAVTAFTMPQLVAEFPNYFGQGDGIPSWEVDVWARFQENLRAQSVAVKSADAARIAAGQPEFKYMDPARFDCSISV